MVAVMGLASSMARKAGTQTGSPTPASAPDGVLPPEDAAAPDSARIAEPGAAARAARRLESSVTLTPNSLSPSKNAAAESMVTAGYGSGPILPGPRQALKGQRAAALWSTAAPQSVNRSMAARVLLSRMSSVTRCPKSRPSRACTRPR